MDGIDMGRRRSILPLYDIDRGDGGGHYRCMTDMGRRWRTLSLYDINMGRRWRTLSLYDRNMEDDDGAYHCTA